MALTDRRYALLALVFLLVVLGGSVVLVSSPGEASPMDRVPAEADSVLHVDAETMTETELRRNVTLAALRYQSDHRYYAGPRADEHLSPFVDGPVELGEARTLTMYANHTAGTGTDYGAVVVDAAWDEESVVAAVEADANVTLRATSHRGRTLYVPEGGDGPAVAVLGDGRYVVGDRAAVEDGVDVAAGDAPAIDGPVRRAFETSRPGYVTFAYPFPSEELPESGPGNWDEASELETASGVYYRNGSRLGAEFRLQAPDSSAAGHVRNVLSLGLKVYASRTDGVGAREARRVDVSTTGSEILVVYESRPENASELLDVLER